MLGDGRWVMQVLTASMFWLNMCMKVYACENSKVIRIREDGIQTIWEDIISMAPMLWKQMLPTFLALLCTGIILVLIWRTRPEKE